VRETSAIFTGSLFTVPLNMTSSILRPLMDFADCSPKTHFMLSTTLLLCTIMSLAIKL